MLPAAAFRTGEEAIVVTEIELKLVAAPGDLPALTRALEGMGKVDFGGVSKRVCLEHVPQVRVGEYVVVHVGFALHTVDEAEARRVFEFLATMNQLDEIKAPSHEIPG